MIFQTAGIEVAPWIPPLAAFVISFFTSMGGVSGAFLLLPFQMSFLGYINPSVSATNQLYNIVAIPSGVYRYYKEGRLVRPLAWAVAIGTLPGVFIGVFIRIAYLPDPKNFKLFAAFVLIYISGKMISELLKKNNGGKKADNEKRFQELVRSHSKSTHPNETALPAVEVSQFNFKRLDYSFYGEKYEVQLWGVFLLSFVVGIVGGIYGIGGGAIMAPFFVTILGLPIYTVAGAALMGTFITSVAGVLFFQILAPFYPNMSVAPDWLLGAFFGIGGMLGIYLGARCQKYVPAGTIKWMLSGIIAFTALKYAVEFF